MKTILRTILNLIEIIIKFANKHKDKQLHFLYCAVISYGFYTFIN
jgi:hypothetical protein